MPKYHILNGDCLADQLKQTVLQDAYIICRECLIDGQVNATNITDFWNIRATFVVDTYKASTDDYYRKVVDELGKINSIPDDSEVCLWFENDLFCQVNMWFILSMLSNRTKIKLYRIFPISDNNNDLWKGFGIANTEMLERAYLSKILLNSSDINLGKQLWMAYQNADFEQLKELSKNQSACFQYLVEVCQAHIDRFPNDDTLGRPQRVIKEIIETKSKNFMEVFSEFSIREGIYGLGDLQVKCIYDSLIDG
jgi:hypothetical protein